MNALLISDLHLTAAPRDEYRWNLFPWLQEQLAKHDVQALIILGDLTEAKDYHAAKLVNRIVDALAKLHYDHATPQQREPTIHLLRGNHDGTDPECPYFRFLRRLPFITYYETPYLGPLQGRNVLFLPHSREPERWDSKLLHDAEVIFMHQTVSGAVSETGATLEGIAANALASARRATIWSGDIHVPQRVGAVEYVGAPYPVRFGDAFKPRAVLLEKGLRQARDLEPPRFGRWLIELSPGSGTDSIDSDIHNFGSSPGDQIKIRVRLTRAQFVDWDRIKREVLAACTKAQVELCGLEVERIEEKSPRVRLRGTTPLAVQTPQQVLTTWCERQGVEGPVAEVGQQILSTIVKEGNV